MLTPSTSDMKMEEGFFCEALVRPCQITRPHIAQGHKRTADRREHLDTDKMDIFFLFD
jgi:hypothetical protein